MKQLLLILLIIVPLHAKKQTPQKQNTPHATGNVQPQNDDIDSQIVLASVSTMLHSLGTITTDPYNPVVLGPNLAQIGIGFINIIGQIFKNLPLDQEITREHIQQYIDAMDNDTKNEIINAILSLVHECRAIALNHQEYLD